jgi:hypothetical protein
MGGFLPSTVDSKQAGSREEMEPEKEEEEDAAEAELRPPH